MPARRELPAASTAASGSAAEEEEDSEDRALSPPTAQAQYTITDRVGWAGLPVRAEAADGARKLGKVSRGDVVVGLGAISPPWLRIQWLAAPDCAAWVRVGNAEAGLISRLPGRGTAGRSGSELHAGTLSASTTLRRLTKWGQKGLPKRLSRAEEDAVRGLIRKREIDSMKEIIADEMDSSEYSTHYCTATLGSGGDCCRGSDGQPLLPTVSASLEREAAAKTEAHFSFFDSAVERLQQLGAFETEGIFRVPGSSEAVSALQSQLAAALSGAEGAAGPRIRAVLQVIPQPPKAPRWNRTC